MPITPFHFGPGAALHSLAPQRVSFLAFCAANVLVDVEPLYFMLTGQYPLHRFLHTFVGVSLIVAATVLIFCGLLQRNKLHDLLPDVFGWKALSSRAVLLGSALGGYSHIVLDSVMHSDMEPFWPVSVANPLLGLVPLDWLHGLCLAAGVLGLLVVGARELFRQRSS